MAVSPRNGLRDWIIQRLTALIMLIYILSCAYLLWQQPLLDYSHWRQVFTHAWFRYITVMFFIALIWHAWIGLWTVATDYMKNTVVRASFLSFVILALLSYLLWLIHILWGIIS